MKPRTFYGFAGITAAAVVAAVVAVSMQSDTISLTAGTEPAFPKLANAVNDVAKIEIRNAKGSFSITRDGENWGMDQKEGYRVEFEKVKSAIVNLSQFKLIEKKTSDPERYERLELDTPNSPESKSREIALKDAKGNVLAAAVIGKLNPNLFGSGGAGTYIRRAGEKGTWLARGQVELGEEPNNWMVRQIVNYGQEKVKRTVIIHPDGKQFAISKAAEKDKNFVMENLPEGRKMKNPDETNPLGGVMWRMMFDDVKKADKQAWPEKPWVAYYTTWDGFTVKIETAKFGEDYWGRFTASVDDSVTDVAKRKSAAQTVKDINERAAGWSYMLTAGDSEKLTFGIEEYLAKPKKEGS
ncbi:MAG: DUF4340 domain-containing protein [Alphaproteobacteria bacterium]